mgnify:CR=1 FL=1|jgi:hypothetical protein
MTATEKYNSVLEGSMAKGEFLRQMKQAFPNYLTVSNGFEDSVQILKNRGMISENKLKDIRHIKSPEDNFSLTSIDRGVNYELNKAGIDSSGVVTKEQYIKARQQTILNLQKDQAFYYNLMAGESAGVDKHDKMKETKRGAKDADTFNAMKKATLKENAEPSALREQTVDLIALLKKERQADNEVIKDFIKTHFNDIRGASPEEIVDEFDEFVSVNYESPSDYIEEDEEEYLDKKDAAIKAAMGKEHDVEEMDAAQMDAIKNYTPGSMDERPHEYKPGDMFSTDFDYEGMLKAGLKVRVNTPVETMQAIYDSFEDVNYHRENTHLGDVIDAIKAGDRAEATDALKKYRKEIKETLAGIFEGAFPMRERDENYVPRGGEVVSERVGGLQEFVALIEDRAENNDTTGREEAEEVMYAIGDHYNIGVDIMRGPWDDEDELDRHDVGVPKIDEKKGKDHDGDGDVDGDDYKAAKDKAIKKAMKENVRAIISKVLKEDKAINEAATNQLAKFAEDYAGFEGMKGAILDLQNIVTDIEAYYDKTREKIQKVYDTLGEIRNEEGLKVGGFLAPAIETAFSKDLRPVTKTGFLKGLDTPKVRTISSAEIDAAKRAQGLDEFETAPAPKSNVFAPLRESSYGKNKKKK